MELLKFFIKDDLQPVGLNPFRDEKIDYNKEKQTFRLNFNRQIFKPSYTSNFFLM